MKLIQLNGWHGNLLRQILTFVAEQQPDIVTMQEVFDMQLPPPFPGSPYSMFEEIRQAGLFEFSYMSPNWSFDVSGQPVGQGNAIFSRYPLTMQETIFTRGSFIDHADGHTDISNSFNMQIIATDINGVTLQVCNHHGYWLPDRYGNDQTVASMQRVADEVAKLDSSQPIILAGDLNVVAESPAMRVFDNLLEDLTATHDIPTTLNQFAKVSDVACDHILVNEHVSVADFHISEALVSDHKALILEFEV